MLYARPHTSRCSGAIERARAISTSLVAVARFGRSARMRSASSRSSSNSGNVDVVSVHCVRWAMTADSSSLTSDGFA